MILEDRRTNRLQESRNIFDTIVNNRIFTNISGIILFNYASLFLTLSLSPPLSQYVYLSIPIINLICPVFSDPVPEQDGPAGGEG